jgi:type III pantothenate kinase
MSPFPLIAVDVGNNRTKFGLFGPAPGDEGLPEPSRTLAVANEETPFDRLAAWLGEFPAGLTWWVGSVNRPAATRLVAWLREHRPGEVIALLAAGDLPLDVALLRPDMVGIDRLLDAVGANRLRRPDRPAVVVDIGSAITVDLVSAEGVFRGGAILPGIAMSARALHTFTDLLPLIDTADLLAVPPAIGTDTVAAMRSGLFWGAVGSIRELVGRMVGQASQRTDVFLTGGAGPAVAELLGEDTRHVPHLTLAAIALVAMHRK